MKNEKWIKTKNTFLETILIASVLREKS